MQSPTLFLPSSTRRFLETEVLPYLQKMGETQKDLITDLEGLEQEFAVRPFLSSAFPQDSKADGFRSSCACALTGHPATVAPRVHQVCQRVVGWRGQGVEGWDEEPNRAG